jgi:hypothetical protein
MILCFRGRIAAAVLLLLTAGCSTVDRRQTSQEPPKPYVRICQATTNRTEFQIALRKFIPWKKAGPSIWLVGVSHLGETDYYAKLQSELGQKTLVLFEGIGASRANSARQNSTTEASGLPDPDQPDTTNVEGLQPALARALGLRFQLETLDYTRPNFQNSDLTITELRQLLADQTKGSKDQGAAREFEELLQAMQGQSLLNAVLRVALPFLATSPGLQGVARLALIEILGQIEGNPANIPGLAQSEKQLMEVLVEHRNQRVMEALLKELSHLQRQDSIAILYGVAHMPDMEKRLRSRLHYQPVETRWLTAIEVDSKKAGISEAQIRFLKELLSRNLRDASN